MKKKKKTDHSSGVIQVSGRPAIPFFFFLKVFIYTLFKVKILALASYITALVCTQSEIVKLASCSLYELRKHETLSSPNAQQKSKYVCSPKC